MAKASEGASCLTYTKMWACINFTVNSPDEVCCALCPCLETYARKQCRLTAEYIGDHFRGFWCPLRVEPYAIGNLPDEMKLNVDEKTGELINT